MADERRKSPEAGKAGKGRGGGEPEIPMSEAPDGEERPTQPRNRAEGIERLHEATDEINGVW